jgi:hypothetical protein
MDDVGSSALPVDPFGENVEQPEQHRVLIRGREPALVEEREHPLTEILE